MSTQRHTARLVLQGHIIDSMMLPQVMDMVMDLGGNFTIEELKVGQHKTDTSICRMEVTAGSSELLDRIVQRARSLGATAEHEVPVRAERVQHEGVFPEGFYSTSNLPTEVLLDGNWVHVERIEMDAAIAVDRKAGRAWCIVFQDAKPGMEVVVGATAPNEIADVRRSSPLPFLIPGIGAQGGDLEGSVRAAWNGDPASCLVSASRSVLFAEKPSREAAKLKDQINAVVGAPR